MWNTRLLPSRLFLGPILTNSFPFEYATFLGGGGGGGGGRGEGSFPVDGPLSARKR